MVDHVRPLSDFILFACFGSNLPLSQCFHKDAVKLSKICRKVACLTLIIFRQKYTTGKQNKKQTKNSKNGKRKIMISFRWFYKNTKFV